MSCLDDTFQHLEHKTSHTSSELVKFKFQGYGSKSRQKISKHVEISYQKDGLIVGRESFSAQGHKNRVVVKKN